MGYFGMTDDMSRYFESQCDRLGLDQAGADWIFNTYAEVLIRVGELDAKGRHEISVHASPMATNCSNPTYMSVTYPQEWYSMESLLDVVATLFECDGRFWAECDRDGNRIFWDTWAAAGMRTPYIVLCWNSPIDAPQRFTISDDGRSASLWLY